MTEMILSQAEKWGFICDDAIPGKWQIFPQQKTEKWKLQVVGDRWLLVVGEVPQMNLRPEETLAFLQRRRSNLKNLKVVKVS